MKFKNKIGKSFIVITALLLIGLCYIFIDGIFIQEQSILSLIVKNLFTIAILIPMLILLINRKDRYEIDGQFLYYNMVVNKGKIEIASIKKIERKKRFWLGLQTGVVSTGLVIYFNKYDEVFLTPEEEDDFVKALKESNPTIEVKS